MKKTIKKRICMLLAVIFLINISFSSVFSATEEELNAMSEAAEAAIEAANYEIDMTCNTIDDINWQIEKADEAIVKIDGIISVLDQEIASVNKEIEATKASLAQAEAKCKKQEQDLRERLKIMYMFGNEGYFYALFSSDSIGQLLERIDVMASVITADNNALKALEATRQEIEKNKKDLEREKAEADLKKNEQITLKAKQEDILAQQKTLLANNQDKLGELQALKAEEEAIMAQAREQLAAIAAEAQRQRAEESGGSSSRTGSGTYIWPSDFGPDCITSYFGYREAPIAGASTYHEGLDIGADYGSAVYACASGEVVKAEWDSGFGNYVMIAHDTGMTTLYAHNSSLAVGYGEWVEQGQVIAYCGSTGISTGPHIHLSFITSSGEYVNPLDYLTY